MGKIYGALILMGIFVIYPITMEKIYGALVVTKIFAIPIYGWVILMRTPDQKGREILTSL